jgi:hypothetical protein
MPAPNFKHQTRRITIAAGTAAGDYSFKESLDNSYRKCVGYVVYQNSNPTIPYEIGLKDDTYTYQHPTNSQDYISSTAVPKSDRYTKADIKAANNAVTITIRFDTALPAPLDISFVFLLQEPV